MSKKTKKMMSMLFVVALVAIIGVAGMLAYLSSESSDVNVMELGNVKIEQIEYERVVDANGAWVSTGKTDKYGYIPDKVKDFEQAKPLFPAVFADGVIKWDDRNGSVNPSGAGSHQQSWAEIGAPGSNQLFDDSVKNVQDKFVFVENTGKSDAYVRTWIALEQGDIAAENFKNVIMTNADKDHWAWETVATDVKIEDKDGVEGEYYVLCVTYLGPKSNPTGILKAGTISYPSLLQVYMKPEATNEDVEAIDSNNNGTYDILVLSQATQTNGFADAKTALDTAFGEATAANVAEWFGDVEVPTAVATAAELGDALAAGNNVFLTEDVTVTSTMTVPASADAKIDLNGNDLSYAVSNSGASAIINNKGDLEIIGEGTISFIAANPDLGTIPTYATNTITNTGTLTIGKGVTVTNGSDGGASYAVDVQSGKFTLDGGTLIGVRCALRVARFNSDAEFVMNSGLVEAKTPAWIQLPGSNAADAPNIDVTINGGTFQSTNVTSADNDVLYTYSFGNSHANTSVTINGGEFLGGTVSIGSGYKGDAPKLTINGGTFEYNVLQWLADDTSKVLYSANK